MKCRGKRVDSENLLGINFDKKLTFKMDIEDLCKNANEKLYVLAQVSNLMDPIKVEILMKRLSSHKTALKLVYKDTGRELDKEKH